MALTSELLQLLFEIYYNAIEINETYTFSTENEPMFNFKKLMRIFPSILFIVFLFIPLCAFFFFLEILENKSCLALSVLLSPLKKAVLR